MLMGTNGHTILSEDYVSFEVAKLLKKKGVDIETNTYYYATSEYTKSEMYKSPNNTNWNNNEYYYSAPTHQMAMKWLREEKYVLIFIVPAKDENGNLTYCADVWTWNDDEGIYEPIWAYANHIYEKVVESALKYSLENLI